MSREDYWEIDPHRAQEREREQMLERARQRSAAQIYRAKYGRTGWNFTESQQEQEKNNGC